MLLKIENCFLLFAQFLSMEFSSENMMFIEDVKQLEQLKNDNDIISKGEFIIETYIMESSEMEINLGEIPRKEAIKKFKENSDISGIIAAKNYILKDLQGDSFIRFLRSVVLKRYLATTDNIRASKHHLKVNPV